MLLGNAARGPICRTLTIGDWSLLPADLDGPNPPPINTPNYLMELGYDRQSLLLWQFHVDFSSLTSTLTGPTTIPVAGYANACEGQGVFCIPQAGTSQLLDSLGDRLMHRLAYRNFGDYDVLLANHSVGSPSGIRWYEIRNPGSSPVLYQQGTFSPDSSFRWMGSIAMDGIGDIAVGYSVSSTTINPAVRYAGRVPTDPLGTMETENSIIEGGGSQLDCGFHCGNRWGDYTSMTVDPVFDCAMWYTNEYYPTSSDTRAWSTRIASFQFPSCVGCVGDCNRDHVVAINELVIMINIILGNQPIINCLRGDANGDGVIESNEIDQAVNNFGYGCPVPGLTPAREAGPIPGPIADSPVTLRIGSAAGASGSSVTIPVSLKNGGGEVSAAELDLLYPTAVLGNPTCEEARRVSDHSLYTSLPSDPEASAGQTRLRALLVDLTAASTFTDGPIFSCTFDILPGAEPGTYSIGGDRQNVSAQGDELISTVLDGAVRVY